MARRHAGFSDRVRQELTRHLPGQADERGTAIHVLLGLSGSLLLRGSEEGRRLRLEVSTPSGAVARAAFTLLNEEMRRGGEEARPELVVVGAGGLRDSARYIVAVEDGAERLARDLGILDGAGLPAATPRTRLLDSPRLRRVVARTALLTASMSSPGREAHLEVRAPSRAWAEMTAGALSALAEREVPLSEGRDGWRAVMKSGEAIGRLLAAVGAPVAFLEWEEHRIRRELREEANRLANADTANLRRAIEAAADQVAMIERAVDALGWDGLDRSLREVALARIANPEASLAELGALCDPPVGKSAVHRRLARLQEIGRRPRSSPEGDPG